MKIEPLYVDEKETAKLLGHDIGWLRSNRDDLEKQFGLPKIDPATQKRHRESIEQWARSRNMTKAKLDRLTETHQENFDAL